MRKIKIFIVEDNNIDRLLLEKLFKSYFLDIEVVGFATEVETAFQLILETIPDIVFLGMELNNSKGFDVLEKFNGDFNFQVIACSTNEEYAKECFAHNIIDFLLKPFALEKVLSAVNKAKKQLELIGSYKTIYQRSEFPKFIALGTLSKAIIVKPKEISYLKAEGKNTLVILKDSTSFLISKLLGDFEKLLDPSIFYRVHNSYILSLHEIVSFNRPKITYCLLRSGDRIPIAQRKAASFSKYLLQS